MKSRPRAALKASSAASERPREEADSNGRNLRTVQAEGVAAAGLLLFGRIETTTPTTRKGVTGPLKRPAEVTGG